MCILVIQAQPPINKNLHRKISDIGRNNVSRNLMERLPEICGNGIDDDGNGLTDMKDFSCYFSSIKQDTCITSRILWASFAYNFYRLDMDTREDTLMPFPAGERYDDISWTPDGKLYGAESFTGAIFEINPNTAETRFVIKVPGHYATNGMCSDAQSNLYLSSLTTYQRGTWNVVKLNPKTGQSSIVANLSEKGLEASGDLTFFQGFLYVSCIQNKLAKIDILTGKVEVIHYTGTSNGFGLVTTGDGYLYISNGIQLNRLDPETWISSPYYNLPTYGFIFGLSIYNEYCDAWTCRPQTKISTGSSLPFCSDNGVLLLGEGSGILGGAELKWSLPDGSTHNGDTLTAFKSGKYYLSYTALKGDCMSFDSIDINIQKTPEVFLGKDTSFCEGQKLILTAPPGSGLTYEWQDKSTGINYSVPGEGTYSVKVTNQWGCSASDTINIIDKTVPYFSIGRDTIICEGSVNLILQPVPAMEGNFSWSTGETSAALIVTTPGYYNLTINNAGCVRTGGISIQTKPAPVVFLGKDTSICEGTGLVLNAYFAGATYLWQDGSTNPQFQVEKPGNYKVSLEMGGCKVEDVITISSLDKPRFTLGSDTALCPGSELLLQPQLNVLASYLWQDGSTQSYFSVKDSGYYSLKASNICGSYTDEVYVRLKNCLLYLPNAFTPNGDGINDVFRVAYPLQLQEFRLSVYNRFGQKVFETNDIKQGWDSRHKGILQPAGTYVWTVHLKEAGKEAVSEKGRVSLLR